ncbi:MAG TPA: hypothetical protein PKU97_10600 [Kofleriaceae bacterium]|nr:hypothetical protein [Kofleriaceae bacterium]
MLSPFTSSRGVRHDRRWLAAAFAALACWAALSVVRWQLQRRAVLELPPVARHQRYQQLLQTLAGPCLQAEAPERICQEDASLILSFPECDRTCRLLARAQRPGPAH